MVSFALEETSKRISAALAPGEAQVYVDQRANQVVVRTGGGLSADDPRLAGAEGMVRLERAEPFELKSCDPRHCAQRPILGGIRLDIPRDDGTVGGCTAGFRLRSAITGVQYVLTAGHCVRSATHTHVDHAWHEYLGPRIPVTVEDSDDRLAENDPANGRDYAIMPYQPGAEELWLNVSSDRTRPRHALRHMVNYVGRESLPINGFTPFADIQIGWVVCASGSGYTPEPGEVYVDSGAGRGYVPGTHCGEITGKTATINVRICARKGDSGGPLFTEADGKALGILSGGDARSGPCVAGDTETNQYAPISTILTRVNARTADAYRFELVPPVPLAVVPPQYRKPPILRRP